MITLTTLKTRVSQVLDDPGGVRFGSEMLEEAIRLALETLNIKLPRLERAEITVVASGRDQTLPDLEDMLYLVSLTLNLGQNSVRELEPESEFSYLFRSGQPAIHFSGRLVPQAGDTLSVTYAARHTLEGLDEAAASTVPLAYFGALINGAAGHACLLRAARLAEAYGARPAEANQLLEISRLRLEGFNFTLTNLKVLQEFGFPPGFALDADDSSKTGKQP